MTPGPSPRRGRLLALLLFTLALHLPFIHQAFHIDDVYYLALAKNALQKPFFPDDMQFVFDGRLVSMAGHTHAPMNAYFLAFVWFLSGKLTEPLAHGFYLLFPLLATWAFYSLARRFTAQPVLATLLFATVPPLVVMSHTVMADVPTLALALAGIACFIAALDDARPGLYGLAALALSLGAFCAYIALAALPVLFLYAWLKRRFNAPALAALSAPPIVLALWQYANYLHLGEWPFQIMRRYLDQLGYYQVEMRAGAWAGVFVYLGGTLVFPLLLLALVRKESPWLAGPLGFIGMAVICFAPRVRDYALPQRLIVGICFGLGVALGMTLVTRLWNCLRRWSVEPPVREEAFLLLWVLLALAAVMALYYVGSNRYVLPVVPPLLLWLVNRIQHRFSARWVRGLLLTALVWNVGWSLALAQADYQFAGAYREYARNLAQKRTGASAPLFFSGEWGFRYYLTEVGGTILTIDSEPVPGAWVIKSRLCLSRTYQDRLNATLVPIEREVITVSSPLRLLDSEAYAGFYAVSWGLMPWSWSRRPLDVVTLYQSTPFFFALDTARLENASTEQVYPTEMNHQGERELVFVQPPNSAVTYTLALPADARLRFRPFAEFPSNSAGEVRYRVTLRDRANSTVLWERELRAGDLSAALRQPIEVPLRRWEKRPVELRFSIEGNVTRAPTKSGRAGWAGLTVFGR